MWNFLIKFTVAFAVLSDVQPLQKAAQKSDYEVI